MATTMKLIGKSVLGSDAADVTFSSIPQTGYTDLLFVYSARTSINVSGNADDLALTFNGNTSSYSNRRIYGLGSGGVGSQTNIGGTSSIPVVVADDGSTANTFGSGEVYIPNYAGATNKSVSFTGAHETNASLAVIIALAGLWSNTAAITSLSVTRAGYNIKSGSSFFLYGITKA
jgi:hypothetical protein